MVGRYAKKPQFDLVRLQKRPRDQGCLAEALGTPELVNFDIEANYAADHQTWVQEQVTRGMRAPDAHVLKMPARSYAALRISSSESCVGVAVCESADKGRFTVQPQRIFDALKRHESTLAAFAVEAAAHGTYLTNWQKGGF
jgi:hypothetical protein